jgi:hypothetical protein
MTIEHLKTSDLIPYARNAKKHDAAQISKLCGSIKEFGFTNPVLIDKDNGIIAGHGRVLAAQSLALETVPCIRLGHLTDTQRRAYILADNRLAEIGGGWDEEMLKLELADLAALDVDVAEIGFGAEDLADLDMADEPETSDADAEPQIDKAEELRAKWGVEPGQLWELGDHRLLCGDSTKKEDVDRVMGGENADVCLTDPPYGLGKGKESGKNNYDQHDDSRANLEKLAKGWLPIARKICKAVVFSPGVTNAWIYPEADWVMCWFYGGGQLRSSWGFNCWQPFLCYGKCPSLATGNGGRPDAVDMNTPANSGDIDHPCPKPVKLWCWFIERLSFNPGAIFYEPFSGSGTTIIACEQLGRKCRAIEISPAYVAVAIQRWVDATGKEPKRLA